MAIAEETLREVKALRQSGADGKTLEDLSVKVRQKFMWGHDPKRVLFEMREIMRPRQEYTCRPYLQSKKEELQQKLMKHLGKLRDTMWGLIANEMILVECLDAFLRHCGQPDLASANDTTATAVRFVMKDVRNWGISKARKISLTGNVCQVMEFVHRWRDDSASFSKIVSAASAGNREVSACLIEKYGRQ
jgi:hypothetical protein